MHQAVAANSSGSYDASPGKAGDFSAPRRNALRSLAAAPLALVAGAAMANEVPEAWSALDWLRKWHDLGCGAHWSMHGSVYLVPRLADSATCEACGELLAMLTGERLREIGTLAKRHADAIGMSVSGLAFREHDA